MPSFVIEDHIGLCQMVAELGKMEMPYSVTVAKGRKRSLAQNRLQHEWMKEIAEQLGDHTPEEVRGYCKLHFGVPIRRADDEVFREKYDQHIKGLPYEAKIAAMMEPLDMPVTRDMTTEQLTRYLDEVHRHFAEQGVTLTDPDGLHEAA